MHLLRNQSGKITAFKKVRIYILLLKKLRAALSDFRTALFLCVYLFYIRRLGNDVGIKKIVNIFRLVGPVEDKNLFAVAQ